MAYKDFKSYIQDKYCDLLTTAIKEYVDNHHDGIGFHDFNVLSLLKQKVENVEAEDARWLSKDILYSVQWLPADITLLEKIELQMG